VDNIMENLSGILGGMSGEDMDSLRAMAQSMLGGTDGTHAEQNPREEKPSEQSGEQPAQDSAGDSPFSGITPEMLLKISTLMSSMNKKDQRSDLIMALKPHLSPERRKKADDAVQMMKLMSLLPILQGEGGLFK